MKLPSIFKTLIIAALFWRSRPAQDVAPNFTFTAVSPPLRTEPLPEEDAALLPYDARYESCPIPDCWCHETD